MLQKTNRTWLEKQSDLRRALVQNREAAKVRYGMMIFA